MVALSFDEKAAGALPLPVSAQFVLPGAVFQSLPPAPVHKRFLTMTVGVAVPSSERSFPSMLLACRMVPLLVELAPQ